jgi:hypothetical protein
MDQLSQIRRSASSTCRAASRRVSSIDGQALAWISDESVRRSRPAFRGGSRKVRTPQSTVVGNAHPG